MLIKNLVDNAIEANIEDYQAIEDTLIRIFPEWDEYITERLVKERLKVIDKS